jgi:DNA-binding MarR family transcriptional regulator
VTDDIRVETRAPRDLPPTLASYVGHLLHRALSRAENCARLALPAGRHPRDYVLLVALNEFGPGSQQQAADRLGVNRTIMVKLVDRLESEDLVRRARNPGDRRSYALTLTERGRDEIRRLDPAITTADAALTEHLTPVERTRMNLLLSTVLAPFFGEGLPDTLTKRSGFLVKQSHQRMHEATMVPLGPLGIDVRHFGTLAAITNAPAGGCSQQDLARALGVSGTLMVALTDELEAAGLAVRHRNPLDRRSYALALTDDGRRVLAEAGAALRDVEQRFLAPIGPEGREELRVLLLALVSGAPPPPRDLGCTGA